MTDYKERFKRLFVDEDAPEYLSADTDQVLAFIEGTVQLERQEAYDEGYDEQCELCVERERQRITSMIEGMRKPVCGCDEDPDPQAPGYHSKDCNLTSYGYNQALDDLLTHLRGEETIIPEPDCPNCLTIPCKGWKMCRSRQEETLGTARELDIDESSGAAFLRETTCRGDFCKNKNCHKPRTEETECEWCKANGTPKSCSWCSRTEETDHYARIERQVLDAAAAPQETSYPTEKEGASFSGRGDRDWWEDEFDEACLTFGGQYKRDSILTSPASTRSFIKRVVAKSRPKENPTPQSREQRLAYLKSKSAEEHPQGHEKCPMCVEIKMLERDISREQGGEKKLELEFCKGLENAGFDIYQVTSALSVFKTVLEDNN